MPKDRHAISVLIPAYNAEPYIDEALSSVLSQTYQPAEIVVFDDGSSDGTYERLRAYGDRIRLLAPERMGFVRARNHLLEHARFPWIAYQDADDVWLPHKLETQVAWLRSNPAYEACLGLVEQFLEPGCTIPPAYRRALFEAPDAHYLIQNLLVRRAAVDRVGPFERLDLEADPDWFIRARDAGISFGVVPEVLMRRRWHDSNMTHVGNFDNSILLKALRRSVQRKRRQE